MRSDEIDEGNRESVCVRATSKLLVVNSAKQQYQQQQVLNNKIKQSKLFVNTRCCCGP
jgi:hypothetical protein